MIRPSKIARGRCRAAREQVVKPAGYFKANEQDLLIAWLSDNVVYALENEALALKALEVAEEKVAYLKSSVIKPGERK